MTPLPAPKALNDFFLEARCRLLDLAAILDRIGRGPGAGKRASGKARKPKSGGRSKGTGKKPRGGAA